MTFPRAIGAEGASPMFDLTRRGFATLLGGAAAAWPLAARAQEREKVRRIGVMASLAADDRVAQIRNGAFLQGLQQAGWNVGRNVSIEYRWAGIGEAARRHAAELVALAPDVILAGGSQAATPLLQITQTIPVVFVHTPDPVGSGLVSSLAQPGGNATGFTQFDARGRGTRCGHYRRDRPVGGDPVGRAGTGHAGDPNQPAERG